MYARVYTMNIQDLKSRIENKTLDTDLLVFKISDSDFLSNQYIKEISKMRNQEIQYVESLEGLIEDTFSIFADETAISPALLRVYKVDQLSYRDILITKIPHLIIVTQKIEDKEFEKTLSPYIVDMPKIEEWQWKDYIYSLGQGADTEDLDWMIRICGKNRDRMDSEISKLTLFTENERKYLFKDIIRDGTFDDLTSYSIFNFTNAVTSKDLEALKRVYKEIDRVDINEFGLLTVLLKNFRNILTVQLNSNPTPENTGLDGKQLYAIKKLPRVYSAEQLVKIFEFLCEVDSQIKTGNLPVDILIDYLVIKILNM